MTSDRRVERLPDLLADMYLGPTPDYRDDVLARVGRVRQRPAWTFPERWLPMDLVDRRRALVPNLPWRAFGILALIALLLAAVLAAYAGSQRRLPPPFGPAANGAILYAKDGDIYVRDTPTAAPRVLIGDPAKKDQAPTFSRQGDRFMFFRVLTDTDNCECEVWIANADGSAAHKLAGPFLNPSAWEWSPDGSKIVIAYELAGESAITVIPTDGGVPRTIDPGMQAANPTWRPPSGDQLTFRGGANGIGDLYLVRPDGTGLTKLKLPSQGIIPDQDFNHGFSWSPDGRRLAYETWDQGPGAPDGGLRIHIADVDAAGNVTTDHPLQFDPTAGNELQPVWLPTGDRLVFQTRQISSYGSTVDYLSVAPVPTGSASGAGTATRIGPSSTDGGGIGFEVAPDGHSLLVLFWTAQTTWRYDLDTLQFNPDDDLGPLDVSSYQRLAP